jgi:cytochrome c oxidase subunit 2
LAIGLTLAACSGVQSALDPAGREAREVADLFWVATIGAAVVWTVVLGIAVYATRIKTEAHDEKVGLRLILWGGVVLPVVVLAALLVYGLRLMPVLRQPGEGLRIEVAGEQFWWRVRYRPAGGAEVASANEIRMPAGERVEFALTSPHVIHAFWIPTLGGKVDMIPGRENRLVLEAEKPGMYRGVCAEFCGASHALMAFDVLVMEKPAFDAWLAAQAAPPPAPQGDLARGRDLFLQNGCGACHAVAGTEARGEVGPNLTRFGSRKTLGAATLPNTADNVMRFIAETGAVKPRVTMPAYPALPRDELASIAAYLGSLK